MGLTNMNEEFTKTICTLFRPCNPIEAADISTQGWAALKYVDPNIFEEFCPCKDMFQDNDQGDHGYLSDTVEQNVISLIVEEGIVAEFAQTVSDLDEVIVRNGQEILSHTINYGSETYKYEDVDQFIMVYLRNDAFSAEYQKEIADSFPDYSTVSYSEVVSIVGLSELSNVILQVAGADGLFVA